MSPDYLLLELDDLELPEDRELLDLELLVDDLELLELDEDR